MLSPARSVALTAAASHNGPLADRVSNSSATSPGNSGCDIKQEMPERSTGVAVRLPCVP